MPKTTRFFSTAWLSGPATAVSGRAAPRGPTPVRQTIPPGDTALIAEHFQAFADLGCLLLAYRRLTKHSHLG
ncbi:hypothetical protein KRMM14A1259_68440 [Krasilnikovia sp. MM14-A1259]